MNNPKFTEQNHMLWIAGEVYQFLHWKEYFSEMIGLIKDLPKIRYHLTPLK